MNIAEEIEQAAQFEAKSECPRCRKPQAECTVLPFLLSTRTRVAAFRLATYWHQLEDRAAMLAHQDGSDALYQMQKLGVAADVLLALNRPLRDTAALGAAKKFARAETLSLPDGRRIHVATFLLLIGNRGIGKSVAAGYATHEVARRVDWNGAPTGTKSEPLIWVQAREVSSRQEFGAIDNEWLERLRCTKLLVLDDLGDEATEQGLVALKNLILARYEQRRRTVLTSNLKPEDFRRRYSDALVDRLNTVAIAPDLAKQKNLRGHA